MLPSTATGNGRPGRWVVRAHARPTARARVICVPHAGAAASAYRHWPALMSGDVEVLAVQLPGREDRILEPALTSLPEVVDRLAGEVAVWLDRPYALFGHSMGALIAFELARAVRADGLPAPAHLFVSACGAPHRPGPRRVLDRLSDADLLAELKSLTASPDQAMQNNEFLQVLLPTLRADCRLCATYEWKAGAPLSCPVTAFGGRRDKAVTRADLAAWAGHTTGRFELQLFPGDHFYLDAARASVLPDVLRAVQSRLAVPGGSLVQDDARPVASRRPAPRRPADLRVAGRPGR